MQYYLSVITQLTNEVEENTSSPLDGFEYPWDTNTGLLLSSCLLNLCHSLHHSNTAIFKKYHLETYPDAGLLQVAG